MKELYYQYMMLLPFVIVYNFFLGEPITRHRVVPQGLRIHLF